MSSKHRKPNPKLYTVSSGGDPATRTRILEETLELLRKGRGAVVTMAEVAKAADISRQAIYLHFADRAELFIAVARFADERRGLEKDLQKIWDAPDGIAALREAAAMQGRQNPKIWPIAGAIDAIRRSDESAERAWQDRLSSRLTGARRIVRRLKEERLLRPDLEEPAAVDLLWSILSLRVWEDLVLGRGWSAERYARHIGDLLVRGLTVHP